VIFDEEYQRSVVTPGPGDYRSAAGVIKRHGLAQEAFHDEDGYCTVGALREVMGVGTGAIDLHPLADMLGSTPGPVKLNAFDVVTGWNDMHGRTPEDVITLLEQAAEKLEADR
jgi:hypothetical protein